VLSRPAGIAQLVEHNLAKVGVAGSSPVSRSRPPSQGSEPRRPDRSSSRACQVTPPLSVFTTESTRGILIFSDNPPLSHREHSTAGQRVGYTNREGRLGSLDSVLSVADKGNPPNRGFFKRGKARRIVSESDAGWSSLGGRAEALTQLIIGGQGRQTVGDAGWSSLVARRAHNPEVAGSNPAPAIPGAVTGDRRGALLLPKALPPKDIRWHTAKSSRATAPGLLSHRFLPMAPPPEARP
jgi:hypothetical protein